MTPPKLLSLAIMVAALCSGCLPSMADDATSNEESVWNPSTEPINPLRGPRPLQAPVAAPVHAPPALPDVPPPIATALGEPANIDISIAAMAKLGRDRETCMQRGHALDSGFYGRVEYAVQVAPDGAVTDVRVVQSHALSPAVIECIRLSILKTIYPAPGGNGATRQFWVAEP